MGILFQRRHLGDCLLLIKNGANIKQDKGTGGIPITRIETLSGGVFNRDRLGYAGIDQPGKYESFILESGDLLFSHINSKAYIGRTVLYQKEGSEVIIHGMNLLRIKVIPELLIPKYLYYTTLTEGFKSQVASSRKDAVNQSSISVSDIKRIIIPVPSLIEQQRIVDELDLLTGIIEKKNAQLRDLDTLAQSIFYEMFGNIIANEKKWPFGRFADICAPRSSIKRASKSYLPSDSIEYIDISSIDNKRQKLTGTTAFIFSDAPSRAQQVVQYEDVYNPDKTFYKAPENISQSGSIPNNHTYGGKTYTEVVEMTETFTQKYKFLNTWKYIYETPNNLPLLRLSDIILCKAEVLNELNGPCEEALSLINRVRERAFQNSEHNLTLSDYPDKAALRNAICDERMYELNLECLRRPDLIRMGLWKDRMQEYVSTIAKKYAWKEVNESKQSGYYDGSWAAYPAPDSFTDKDLRMYMPIPYREVKMNPTLASARDYVK